MGLCKSLEQKWLRRTKPYLHDTVNFDEAVYAREIAQDRRAQLRSSGLTFLSMRRTFFACPMLVALLALLTLLAGVTPLYSQTASAKNRLFRFPEKAAFTVDFGRPVQKPAAGQAPAAKSLSRADVTSSGKIRRVIKTWDDGSTTQEWHVGTHRLIEHPSGKWINVIDVSKNPAGRGLSYDASDFAWISEQNRSGEATYKGAPCLRYATKAEAPSGNGGESREAVIDANTLAPLVLVKGSLVAVYTFRAPPQGELQLPPRFEQFWKEIEKNQPRR